VPGWSEDITDARSEDDLPANARAYIELIADAIGVPVALVSVGPGREQVIWTTAGMQTAVAGAVA
jgi:adenylosuccinate synthase